MHLPVDTKDILAVIPCRAGSRRLERKNLLPCFGVSLLERAYQYAKALGVDTIITTDSSEVVEMARFWGCTVRYTADISDHLHSDTCTAMEVLNDAWKRDKYHYALYLEPTSPNRILEDAYRCLVELHTHTASATVSEVTNKHLRVYGNRLQPLFSEASLPTEEKRYRPTGCVYAARADHKGGLLENSRPVIIRRPVANIDTIDDLEYAEFLLWRQASKSRIL